MSERTVVLDQPEVIDEQAEILRKATERAERAEAELARLKHAGPAAKAPARASEESKQPPSPSTAANTTEGGQGQGAQAPGQRDSEPDEVAEMRKDSMMAHLLDSLDAGKDIGHYGRLVFAMVARHFLPHEAVLAYLTKDSDFSDEQATLMLRQVEGRDYNPPKRDRILEWQSEQEFPILPHPDDPDCGNLYRNLKFPDKIYDHISHYQEGKLESEAEG